MAEAPNKNHSHCLISSVRHGMAKFSPEIDNKSENRLAWVEQTCCQQERGGVRAPLTHQPGMLLGPCQPLGLSHHVRLHERECIAAKAD